MSICFGRLASNHPVRWLPDFGETVQASHLEIALLSARAGPVGNQVVTSYISLRVALLTVQTIANGLS